MKESKPTSRNTKNKADTIRHVGAGEQPSKAVISSAQIMLFNFIDIYGIIQMQLQM